MSDLFARALVQMSSVNSLLRQPACSPDFRNKCISTPVFIPCVMSTWVIHSSTQSRCLERMGHALQHVVQMEGITQNPFHHVIQMPGIKLLRLQGLFWVSRPNTSFTQMSGINSSPLQRAKTPLQRAKAHSKPSGVDEQ